MASSRAEQSPHDIVVLGAGGHASVLAEAIDGAVRGHLSPAPSRSPDPALGAHLGDDGAIDGLAEEGASFVLGVGFVDRSGARARAVLIERLVRVEAPAVVHPSATVASSVRIGRGAFVGPGATIGANARLGDFAIVNSGAIVDHDSDIGPNAHIAPGAVVSGSVVVGAGALVGAGAVVLQGRVLGEFAVAGAGSVVRADVAAAETVVGVPARALDVGDAGDRDT